MKSYVGKTLREYLRESKNNVKIGAKGGFFWCGVPNEETSQVIGALSDKYYNDYKRKLEDVKRYLDNFEKIWDAELRRRGTEVVNQHRDTPELMEEIRKEWVIDKRRYKTEALDKKGFLTSYVKGWKNLLDREIIDHYPSIDNNEPDGTEIIIIIGEEKGLYWMTKEYRKTNDK